MNAFDVSLRTLASLERAAVLKLFLLVLAAAGGAAWLGCGTDRVAWNMDGGDGGIPDVVVNFPDSQTTQSFTVDPSAEQDITVACGAHTPTVSYNANNNGSPVSVGWSVDRGEVGAVAAGPSSSTTFVPTGTAGGLVNVSAVSSSETVQRQVLVKLTCSQNGYTSFETGQVPTNTNQLTQGGGVGGVGGEGLGAPVTDANTLTALNTPTSNGSSQGLKLTYPYDKTVWPRGMLAPLLMWDWSTGDADAIKIDLTTTSGSFSWSGTFARPAILQQTGGKFIRHPIPDDVWQWATDSAGGMINGQRDRLVVSVTIASNGQGYGPIKETWDVAQGRFTGTVYYQSYNTHLVVNATANGLNYGAATLGIKHGAQGPTLVTSTSTECRVCHSVAANGSALTTQQQYDTYPLDRNSSYFDLKNNNVETDLPATGDARYGWGAISPDGTLLFGNTLDIVVSPPSTSLLYAMPSGATIPTTGLPSGLGGGTPAFSPDSKHIAFNFVGGSGADGRSLAEIDFDPKAKVFSNLVTLHTPTAGNDYYPTFLPTSDRIIYQVQTAQSGQGWPAETRGSARATLWWIDVKTKIAASLDALNGKGYLPTSSNHTDDVDLNFEPSVISITSGGYAWVIFTSRRLYGSVATIDSSCSDPRFCTAMITSPTPKKLWVAAIDLNATPGADASHPAFYLPAQELLAGNDRAYWVLDPCESDGQSCETGDQCCGGHCTSSTDGGGLVCGTPLGCSGAGDVCTSNSDCCSGACTAGHCDVPAVN